MGHHWAVSVPGTLVEDLELGTTLGIRILCTLRSFAPSFKLEYGLNDEAVMGRCSTRGGGGGNCPVGNTHRIYQSVDRSP